MVTCLVIELSGGEMVPHGAKSFESIPRIGEHIAMEENDIGFLFQVVAVCHASDYRDGQNTNGADLYVKRVGKEVDALLGFHQLPAATLE